MENTDYSSESASRLEGQPRKWILTWILGFGGRLRSDLPSLQSTAIWMATAVLILEGGAFAAAGAALRLAFSLPAAGFLMRGGPLAVLEGVCLGVVLLATLGSWLVILSTGIFAPGLDC